ncbi:MAG: 2-C-methyl-D-erythritol 4-phosphate cytidylyltransferase [Treponema sp.]|jgi:2-C-methyl-D-erythritol 4-phosphate cytidylyltransferase|nr:2-C-methyl-D-erythritol 4-phosphate cytidylyltransferase [Treponema sp.]
MDALPEAAPWAAVITAAGSSARMTADGQAGIKKEYRPLPGRFDGTGRPLTVLGAAVFAFAACAGIETIVITVPPDAQSGEAAARRALPAGFPDAGGPELLFVPGGKTRRASVHEALSLLTARRPLYVLIHDGARPWVEPSLIRAVMAAACRYQAALPLLPLVETPKEIAAGDLPDGALPGRGAGPVFVKRHLRRSAVGTAQTPQGFAFPEILYAHQKAAAREGAENFDYTDDAEVWGEFCGPVAVVPGSPENRKITFPEDLAAGEPGRAAE